jgi:hypothetical protein
MLLLAAVCFADVLDLAEPSAAASRTHVYLAQTPLLTAAADAPAPLAPLLDDLPATPSLIVRTCIKAAAWRQALC